MTKREHSIDRERGSFSLLLAVLAIGLLVAIGLVVDGGRYITASQLANNAAGEAGRAAGQHITSQTILGQQPKVDTASAVNAAQEYLAAAGVDGTACGGCGHLNRRGPVLHPTRRRAGSG